jgi:hypothetical protein
MMSQNLESILVVYVNPAAGRTIGLDDWYTNIHIRDVMRIDGGIAVQRFVRSAEQLELDGSTVVPAHQAHTIYEWESAEKSVAGHFERAGTPKMQHSLDCNYGDEIGGYFRPVFLSSPWSSETGFIEGSYVLALLITGRDDGAESFVSWFRDAHAPGTLAMPGFRSAALFAVHEASKRQALPLDFPYTYYAVYGLSDRRAALAAWSIRHRRHDPLDMSTQSVNIQAACWEPRTIRITRRSVMDPSPDAAAEEERARLLQRERLCSREEMEALLRDGRAPQRPA